jgi:hypothetical protein
MSDSFAVVLDELEQCGSRFDCYGAPFLRLFPVTGAAVSTLGDLLGNATLTATDDRAARIDGAQFVVGEGPCWDALNTGLAVAESAMAVHGADRWPTFAAAVREEAVASIFAYPLVVGPLRLGAIDMYSRTPTAMDDRQQSQASAMAEVISRHVLRDAVQSAERELAEVDARSRRTVHQATGMVLAQLDLSADDAQLVLRGHSFAAGRAVAEVASDIVDRRLSFHVVDGRIEASS